MYHFKHWKWNSVQRFCFQRLRLMQDWLAIRILKKSKKKKVIQHIGGLKCSMRSYKNLISNRIESLLLTLRHCVCPQKTALKQTWAWHLESGTLLALYLICAYRIPLGGLVHFITLFLLAYDSDFTAWP